MHLFELYRQNTKIEEVLLKVIAINSLYSTRIKNNDLIPLSLHICSIKNLDLLLDEGDINAVNLIGKTTEGINSAYVFASKYCHFHNSSSFAIFDSNSWLTLSEISNKHSFSEVLSKTSTMDFISYKRFINCLNEFIGCFKINKSYKDVDKYLWLYGKELNDG